MYRRAFLLMSMSLDEAKKVLGFPPDADPTPEQVNQAWKKMVFEHHPDRGGSHDRMVEVNVARDVLEGKQRPTYDRSDPSPSTGYSDPGFKPQPPTKNEVTFQEAYSKAGVPAGVTWLFVTDVQRSKHGWMSDSSSKSDRANVVYGIVGDAAVFLAARRQERSSYFIGGGHTDDVWSVQVEKVPASPEKRQDPAWLYGQVAKALRGIGFEEKFNSKVYDLPENWVLNERALYGRPGSAVSIKQWVVNRGLVKGDDPSVSGRKHVVEITHNTSHSENHTGFYAETPSSRNMLDGRYIGEYHKITLAIDGRQYVLDEKDTTHFVSVRFSGKSMLTLIYGTYVYGAGEKKNLTRLKLGKAILKWMSEKLVGLPEEARSILGEASAQMK